MKFETAIAIAFNSQSYHHVMENVEAKFYLSWEDLEVDTKELWVYIGVEVLENLDSTEEIIFKKCNNFLKNYRIEDLRIFMNVLISLIDFIEEEVV